MNGKDKLLSKTSIYTAKEIREARLLDENTSPVNLTSTTPI